MTPSIPRDRVRLRTACEAAGVPHATGVRWMLQGLLRNGVREKLPTFKVGNVYYTTHALLAEYISRGNASGPSPAPQPTAPQPTGPATASTAQEEHAELEERAARAALGM